MSCSDARPNRPAVRGLPECKRALIERILNAFTAERLSDDETFADWVDRQDMTTLATLATPLELTSNSAGPMVYVTLKSRVTWVPLEFGRGE